MRRGRSISCFRHNSKVTCLLFQMCCVWLEHNDFCLVYRRKKRLYLVFEFLERNLLEVLEQDYPDGLEPELIRVYIYQLVKSIAYCHRNDVVHRGKHDAERNTARRVSISSPLLALARLLKVRLCEVGVVNVLCCSSFTSKAWFIDKYCRSETSPRSYPCFLLLFCLNINVSMFVQADSIF